MKILVFDTESSTGCVNDGSLCSFGYVLSDESYSVKFQEDLVINPVASFRRNIIGKNRKVDLAYDISEFYASPKFPAYYDKIKSLFESVDLVMGFAIENDVKYLRNACEKYGLPQIGYKFIDVKQILELLDDEYKDKGLSAIGEGINVDFKAHRSDEDARLTLKVLEYVSAKYGKTLPELIDYLGLLFGENYQKGFSHVYSLSQLYGKHGIVRTNRQNVAFFNYAYEYSKKFHVKEGDLKKKVFTFSREFKTKDPFYICGVLKKMFSMGGRYSPSLSGGNIYVYADGEDLTLLRISEAKSSSKHFNVMSESEFLSLLGEFEPVEFDLMKVYIKYEKTRQTRSLNNKSKKVEKK